MRRTREDGSEAKPLFLSVRDAQASAIYLSLMTICLGEFLISNELGGEASVPLRPGRAGLGELLITNDYMPRRITYH